jgi:carbamoyl-phosphate synthase small subunit
MDTGIKLSIVANLRARGARLILFPCTTDAASILARDPDAVFLANGPGDPAALDHIVVQLRRMIGRKPVFGICLGHQLLCRAVGLETYKLPFGHRGANHPVKDLETGRIEITSQNHGFAVIGPGGARPPRRRRRDRPVPPRGRPRSPRRAPPVRPLRRRDQRRPGELACPGATTSSGS